MSEREALRKLVAEVGGLSAFEPLVRDAIGNTNWAVLQLRLTEAEAALASRGDSQDAERYRWLRCELVSHPAWPWAESVCGDDLDARVDGFLAAEPVRRKL